MKLLIVGGIAGGASAATRARRLSEDSEIVIIERGPDVSFANCGLPYHIGEEIPHRESLLITQLERLRQRYKLDVRTRTDVVAIDRVARSVTLRNLDTGTQSQESYDRIILATGAAPIRLPLPGIDLPGIYSLRTLQDMDRIKAAIDAKPTHAVVIGAGFIGLELAENFLRRGVPTTIIELQNQVLPPLDAEMTTPINETLRKHGVELRLGDSAVGFAQISNGLKITLKSGGTLEAELVVLGIGIRPENRLAVESGLEVGPRGGIRVNRHMQTSDPSIYAVGDVVETFAFLSGEPTQVPLAGPANRQGRLAANHVFGKSRAYRGTQGTAILRIFDRTVAMTGATEQTLERLGRTYRKIYIHPNDHAGYFPGAQSMSIKLLFDPVTGRILGAQAFGGSGVDKRIDILSVAIQAAMTVQDLEESELAYAPPYGSAKDPINMLGFVASGLIRGEHPQIDVDKLDQPTDRLRFVLDVRTPEEFQGGHLPNSVNIPIEELRQRLSELPKDQEIVTYCQVGQRGYLATCILNASGFHAKNLSGGYRTYLLYHPRCLGPAN